ncbi:MAG: MerR family transcriptional regulator [Tritonibacter mobilis]|nr:transcriptional regulator, MerR family [Ruegeria sp. TrichCH4B]MCK5501182.1 MerR family transcriptional regulator [Tritonibacter mobilis]PXW82695.1 MerR family transcriptional regulator [Ruegeria sp. P4]
MKIGEIAKAAGVSTSRIRFYERRGVIPAGDRDANGYRDYPADLIVLLKFIEQAQGLGFSLKEIAEVEIYKGDHIVSCEDALALLAEKHKTVTKLIAEAQDRKYRIEQLMQQLQASRDAAKTPHT